MKVRSILPLLLSRKHIRSMKLHHVRVLTHRKTTPSVSKANQFIWKVVSQGHVLTSRHPHVCVCIRLTCLLQLSVTVCRSVSASIGAVVIVGTTVS